MADTGQLTIRLRRQQPAAITSTRPQAYDRLLVGQQPDRFLYAVPLLFAVCRQAHCAAAQCALEAASDGPCSRKKGEGRDLSVGLEALLEHLWNLFYALPGALQLAPEQTLLGSCNRAIRKHIAQLESGERFDAASQSELKTAVAKALDGGPAGGLATTLTERCQRIDWQSGDLARQVDGPAETGPAARAGTASDAKALIPRLRAIVAETRTLLDHPGALAPLSGCQGGDKRGEAWLETARGRLDYRLSLGDGKLAGLQITSPTDNNFHPEGIAAGLLTSIPDSEPPLFRQRANTLICLLNPCVPYTLDAAQLAQERSPDHA